MSLRTLFPEQLDAAQVQALLTGGVGPRPIALASTVSPEGVRNLAPFSFFNAFCAHPADGRLRPQPPGPRRRASRTPTGTPWPPGSSSSPR